MSTPEHDSFLWEQVRERVFGPEQWQRAAPEAQALMELLGLMPADSILDLPCGTGRHAIELALRGLQVTGVDATASFLVEARTRAEARGCKAEWLHDDMRRFLRPNAFDAALNLYTSFGYFQQPAEDLQVLKNFHASLKPGGRLLMELSTRELMMRHLRPRLELSLDDGFFIEENELRDGARWLSKRVQIVRDGQSVELRFSRRLYSQEELQALLLSCGFQDLEAYGGLDGRRYDDTVERLVLIARRSR